MLKWNSVLSRYDQSGQYLITGAAEGHIFILDARPSKLFQVLGYLGNICNRIQYLILIALYFVYAVI